MAEISGPWWGFALVLVSWDLIKWGFRRLGHWASSDPEPRQGHQRGGR